MSKKQKITSVGEDMKKLNHGHCWWEYKMVQTLWKTAQWFLSQLKIELPYDPSIPSEVDQNIRDLNRHVYTVFGKEKKSLHIRDEWNALHFTGKETG